MDWSGMDYLLIIVMFLSAVWTLILTAPIHCKASIGNAKFHQICSDKRNKLMYLCSKSFKYDLYKLSHLHIRTPTLAVHWKLHCDESLAWLYFPPQPKTENAEKLSRAVKSRTFHGNSRPTCTGTSILKYLLP